MIKYFVYAGTHTQFPSVRVTVTDTSLPAEEQVVGEEAFVFRNDEDVLERKTIIETYVRTKYEQKGDPVHPDTVVPPELAGEHDLPPDPDASEGDVPPMDREPVVAPTG